MEICKFMKKMLIVEDDQFIGSMYSKLFDANGFSSKFSLNGIDALGILSKDENIPEVIILDANLPDMNGLELLRKIKQNDKLNKVPVVVLTNSYHIEDAKMFTDLGADMFLIKIENTNKELVEKINKLLEKH